MKRSKDNDPQDDRCQYEGENHLVGIESFHKELEFTLMLQKAEGAADGRLKGSSCCELPRTLSNVADGVSSAFPTGK